MGRYGPTVGVPRASLETIAASTQTISFFMPAWTMQRYPDAVEAILKAGTKIGHHIYIHEDRRRFPRRSSAKPSNTALAIHVAMTGRKPRGYRCQSTTPTRPRSIS